MSRHSGLARASFAMVSIPDGSLGRCRREAFTDAFGLLITKAPVINRLG
jgi:hypothetical protein